MSKVLKKKITQKVAAPDERASPVFIRTNNEQRGALDAFIVQLNIKRAAAGLPRTTLSAWARDELFRSIGREDLTSTARLRREVEMVDERDE